MMCFSEEHLCRVCPHFQSAIAGNTVEFACTSSKPANWLFQTGMLPSNAVVRRPKFGSEETILLISKIQKSNEGKYNCLGEDDEMKQFEGIGTLTVTGKVFIRF